jgi:hypothetical protein
MCLGIVTTNNMKKIRKTTNANDLLSYVDEEYIIYRKDGQVVGNLMMPLDLIHIGIEQLESEDAPTLFYKKDYKDIILKVVSRLEKTIDTYPEDETIS